MRKDHFLSLILSKVDKAQRPENHAVNLRPQGGKSKGKGSIGDNRRPNRDKPGWMPERQFDGRGGLFIGSVEKVRQHAETTSSIQWGHLQVVAVRQVTIPTSSESRPAATGPICFSPSPKRGGVAILIFMVEPRSPRPATGGSRDDAFDVFQQDLLARGAAFSPFPAKKGLTEWGFRISCS